MKFTLIFITYFLFQFTAFGQAPAIEWERSYGGSQIQFSSDALETPDGGYMIFNRTTSSNYDVTVHYGGTDIWIVKTNNVGDIEWDKTYGGTGDDFIQTVHATADGGYVFCGSTSSSNYDVTVAYGNHDFWLVKINASGDIEWENTFGGSSDDYAIEAQPTSDGGYIITGITSSTNGLVSGNHGQSDIWVVKVSLTGVVEWKKCFGGTSADNGYGGIQTADGGFIIIGDTKSVNGNVTSNHGLSDIWVLKLNAMGTIEWQKTFGGTADDSGRSIRQNPDGSYIILGSTHSSNGDINDQHGIEDFWVCKIDATGNIIWKKCIGGTNTDEPNRMQATNTGHYLLSGRSYGTSYNCWVVKIDDQGNVIWTKSMGGGNDDGAFNTRTTSDGGYMVLGYHSSEGGDAVSPNNGIYNAWVIKLAPDILDIEQISEDDITVYPNPTTSQLNIHADNMPDFKSVIIYDFAGKIVMSQDINFAKIDVSSMLSGTYILKLNGQKTIENLKFVKL